MRWISAFLTALFILLGLPWRYEPAAAGQAPDAKTKSRATIAVWDTRKSVDKPLESEAFAKKEGWTQAAAGKTDMAFNGDCVLASGRIWVVLRKHNASAEIYSDGPDSPALRTSLLLANGNGEPATQLDRLTLSENTKGAVSVLASYKTEKGTEVAAKVRLKKGEVALEVEPGTGADRLQVNCSGRFAILPDFFADDIVVDARKFTPSLIEAPSENFILHLNGKGEAIAMCVFENRQRDIKVRLAGEGDNRMIGGSEIGFEKKKIWVALLEGPQIWHTRDLEAKDAGKVLPLEWKMPFVAQWRVDFNRSNGLTDSWEMLLKKAGEDGYLKPSWLGGGDDDLGADRHRWNTVLGEFKYPCWSDRERKGFLQPLKNKALQFQGPLLVYPINRVKETPLDAYTVVDVMRSTMGVGPCEHLLDLEGQKAEYRGRATCAVRDDLGAIYGKSQQKKEHDEVEKILDDGLTFVKHIRGRITRYVEFGHKMHDYLSMQKKKRPDLVTELTELDKIVQEIDARVAARADKIQTPEHVAKMNEEFRKNVLDYEGADAFAKCKKYTTALVVIGDNQDELSAECRWAVKTLRQRAAILLASEPKLAEVAGEIRTRTQEALRNPANHEGARH